MLTPQKPQTPNFHWENGKRIIMTTLGETFFSKNRIK